MHSIWKEGKYLDLWSLPHFLVGIILGHIFIYFGLDLAIALVATLIIKIAWEIYEHKYVTIEAVPNKILDVVVGIIGLIVIYIYNDYSLINLTSFSVILIINIIFSSWGLLSMKKMNLFIKK
ncbi:MAG: hypothetical protein WC027_02395 [Candidatus Paceibacterota bacterium]